MAEILDKLRGLLEHRQLREALERAFYTGIESRSKFHEISLADHLRQARGVRARGVRARGVDVCDAAFEQLPDKLNEAMQSFVLDRLPQPAPITLADLTSLATTHLAGVDLSCASEDEVIARTYERFVTCAVLEIEQERLNFDSEYFSLGDAWDLPEPDSALADYIVEEYEADRTDLARVMPYVVIDSNLWSSASGFSFVCSSGERVGIFGIAVLGKFRGFCTERALQNLESSFGEGLINSIAKTVNLCFIAKTMSSYPPLSFLTDGDGKRVFAICVSAYCQLPGSEEDSILDRLRNAVILLSHADQAEADPIALSLSFSAIEALVCEKGETVGKQIREHIPTLLESEPKRRTAKRRDALYDLYEIRSQVLHGSRVSASKEASHIVRRIAAGAIRAICVWREHREKAIGEKPTWKDLITELIIASRNNQAVIPELPGLGELLPDMAPE